MSLLFNPSDYSIRATFFYRQHGGLAFSAYLSTHRLTIHHDNQIRQQQSLTDNEPQNRISRLDNGNLTVFFANKISRYTLSNQALARARQTNVIDQALPRVHVWWAELAPIIILSGRGVLHTIILRSLYCEDWPCLERRTIDTISGRLPPAARKVMPITESGMPTVSPTAVVIHETRYEETAIQTTHMMKVRG